MAVLPVFGRVKFERALKTLGFEILYDRGKGGHALAKHPTRKPNPSQQIANITIPHTKSKNYDDPRLRKEIVNVIKSYGFSEEEFLAALKGKKLKK